MLNFRLGDEYYGVDVMTVQSVRTIRRVTRVPGIPHFYRGVVNVRGQVITVLDLRLFFDVPVHDEAIAPDELVVVKAAGLEIGLLAHNIEGVQAIPLDTVEPVENMRYAWGVTRNQLVLLDVERLLEDEQLVVGGADES
jgi:purine-binding chemotaxis protein CheW